MIKISIELLHTTTLGSERIKRNLDLKISESDIVDWCKAEIKKIVF